MADLHAMVRQVKALGLRIQGLRPKISGTNREEPGAVADAVTQIEQSLDELEAMHAGLQTMLIESPFAQARTLAPTGGEQGAAEELDRLSREFAQRLQEIEAASQAKDRFLATLSHELRVPLQPIVTLVDKLCAQDDLPQQARAEMQVIRRNIDLERRLIDDLLDITRISKGKLAVNSEATDMHVCVEQVVAMCREDAAVKRLSLSVSLAARRSVVMGDSARLCQVIWNLVRNAIKFTADGGRIEVRTWDAEGGTAAGTEARGDGGTTGLIVLEVIDSGIGIDPAILPKLFRPFEQGARQIVQKYGGLGLGLAISRALVDAHGGSITCTSAGRGLGSTFRVALPVSDAPVPAPARPAQVAPDAACGSASILLVDDHADTLRILSNLLRLGGHHVVTADSLATGMAAIERERFDLLVADLSLPDGSGLELMQRARMHGIAGIAVSGYGMASDLEATAAAGFAVHLIKPVEIKDLEAAIARVLRIAPAD